MNNSWVMDVESKVFTIVKAKTYQGLTEKYPNIYFTTDDVSQDTHTKDFTVYIHELEPLEVGQDIEGTDINGILSTFEAQVIVSTTKTDCKFIMSFILNAFKELGFQATSLPVITTQGNMHIAIARFRRVIGYGEQ